jgi:hypothetical protein
MSWKNNCDDCGQPFNPDDLIWQIRVGTGRSEKDHTLPGKILQRTYLCKGCIGRHEFGGIGK